MRAALIITAALSLAPLAGMAETCGPQLEATFTEGAPVDRFVIANKGATDLDLRDVQINLAPSRGRLIFDTAGGGQGVEVFQPFRSDAASVSVADGAEALRFPLAGLPAGAQVSFTIDVDDRLTASEMGQIRVSGSEMEGAEITFLVDGTSHLAVFDADNRARTGKGCANKT